MVTGGSKGLFVIITVVVVLYQALIIYCGMDLIVLNEKNDDFYE